MNTARNCYYFVPAVFAWSCLLLVARAGEVDWLRCGELALPPGYWAAAPSDGFHKLHVRFDAERLEFECLCEGFNHLNSDFSSTLLMRNKGAEFLVDFSIATACQEATCDSEIPGKPLQVWSRRKSELELKLAPECNMSVSVHHDLVDGHVSLRSSRTLSQGAACSNSNTLPPHSGTATLELATSFQLPSHTSTQQDTPANFTIKERIPVDLASCIRQFKHHNQRQINLFTTTARTMTKATPSATHDRPRRQSGTNTQPTFDSLYFMVSVLENVDIGTTVTTVRAFDPDSGAAGELDYTLEPVDNLNSGNLFTIGSSSGVITTTAAIDRERIARHDFRVTARDHGSPSLFQVTTYAIEVTDLNDNVPTFQTGSYYNRTVREDFEINRSALDMIVIDEDAEVNAAVEYTLINNTGGVFEVFSSATQVRLTVVRELDYEALTYYHLVLIARDMGTPSQSSCAIIDIYVMDVADSTPIFNASSYTVIVPENATQSTVLIAISATSMDSPHLAQIEYHIIGGNSNNRFHLDLNTGILTLFQPLDFESIQTYYLTVRARSAANSDLRAVVSVMVTVTNINDHAPTFSRVQYTPTVSEMVLPNHHVVTINAEDLDLGVLGEVSYRFNNSDIGSVFNLNPSSGAITTRILLDRELQDVYNFFVIASDGGNPSRSASVRVEIRVTDVNDEAPMFPMADYFAEVSENVNGGAFVIQVRAEDGDAGSTPLQYFIDSGNFHNAFSIGPNDGEVTTQRSLDREDIASYSLVVVASDGQLESQTIVHVSITDINDELPVFDLNLYEPPDVSENLDVGSEIIQLRATDSDAGSNGQVMYTSTDISNKFSLHPTTGVVTLARSLDFEQERDFSFTVFATDGGNSPQSSSARVEIGVVDENDNPPIIGSIPPSVSISENLPAQTSVLRLTASDADTDQNSVLEYSIVGDSRAMQAFGVMPSGLIHTRRSLDRETQDEYAIVVRVTDGGEEPLSDSVTVTVYILDEIDYHPVFSQIVYERPILNFTRRNSILLTVVATSRDVNPSILYAITSGGNGTLFYIQQQHGTIHAATDIDPVVHAGEYTMQITAQHRWLSTTVPVNILIAQDDGIPRLRPLVLYFSAFRSQAERVSHLGTVELLERRGHLQYAFSLDASDARALEYFSITPATGEISVLNSVASGYYALNVSSATSTGTGYVTVEAYISIVTNTTLANAVMVVFGGSMATFASISLEPFAQFVSEVIPCSRERVEVFALQTRGVEADEVIEVALAVRDTGLAEYFPQETVLNRLDANRHLARPESLLEFGSDVCVSEPCANLQQCKPVIQVFKASSASAFDTVDLTDRVYISQPFRQTYVCHCPDGYSRDDLCASELNECDPNPCYFGAECEDLIGGFRCSCPPGTTGKDCSIVCPSASCDPCSPSPCLHSESHCLVPVQDPASHTCTNCPWGAEYSGPNCELTTLSFLAGSYVAFPPIGPPTARLVVSLSFATISANGLLLYAGRVRGHGDFIAVQLVIGQLQVGVSLGGAVTVLRTESLWQLNNQEWHRVDIELNNNVLSVSVSHCSNSSVFLAGDEEFCRLESQLSGEHRTLDVNTPLYIGGLEPFIASPAVSRSSFDGCISNVSLSGRRLDLASPLRGYGTQAGCPPLEGRCSQARCSGSGGCVRVWNGSVCQDDMSASSVQLSPGFLHLSSDQSTVVNRLSLSFRTRTTDAVLVQFGSTAAIELRLGSVVYSRGQDAAVGQTALTLSIDAFANDGLWHSLRLDVADTHTELSIDEGRITSRLPESGPISISSLTLGSDSPSLSSGRFSGCLSSLVLNSGRIDLAAALASGAAAPFNTSSEGGAVGCDGGEGCEGVECPSGSTCQAGWQNHSCVCDSNLQPRNSHCLNPCTPNPCRNGGVCLVIPSGSTCDCQPGFQGGVCEEVIGAGCPTGFHSPPSSAPCQRCTCAPQGVTAEVCDASSGQCFCKPERTLFSRSGDLGCKSCDCHMPGSTSAECDAATGQCPCLSSRVVGRSCDQCSEGNAGLHTDGLCHTATMVYGSFALQGVGYSRVYGNQQSVEFLALSFGLATQLEFELYQFGLSGRFEVQITAISESSLLPSVPVVEYSVASYFLQDHAQQPRPLPAMLSGAVQMIVQSGSVGRYLVNASSHAVPSPVKCSELPLVCGGCPQGSELNGIICQAALPQGCNGADGDRDGVPDSCDLCPHLFNPTQANSRSCDPTEGVCPGGMAWDTLWAAAASGATDIKPCPPPLIGFASRACEEGGEWGPVDNSSCVSVQGQDLLAQAVALTTGQLLSESELRYVAEQLRAFTSAEAGLRLLLAGDIQSGGRLLDQLVSLTGHLGTVSMATLQVLVEAASNLLAPEFKVHWVGVVEEAGFGSEDFLRTMENISQVIAATTTRGASPSSSSSNNFDEENLSILSESIQVDGMTSRHYDIPIADRRLSASVTLPADIIAAQSTAATPSPSSSPSTQLEVVLAHVASLSEVLPERPSSELVENFTAGTPLLSVQVWTGGEAVTSLPSSSSSSSSSSAINFTLQYREELLRPQAVKDAVCVSWQFGETGGWSSEGCGVVGVNSTHCSCQCSHLSVFAVLLPRSAFGEARISVGYDPAIFTYIVLGCVCVLLLGTFCILCCVRAAEGLQNTVHKNQVAALFFTTLLFAVGINRTEIPGVCSAVGVGLMFLLLSFLCWLLVDTILIARLLLQTRPHRKFLVYLIIIGWAFPLLLCGIPAGVVSILTESFVEDFGYPRYCWLAPSVLYAFVTPAVLLLVLYGAGAIFCVVLISRMKNPEDSQSTLVGVAITKNKASVSLCVSVAVTLLFVVTWVFGLLAVYGFTYLEYPFAILYAALGMLLFVVLCLNSKVRNGCRAQLQKSDGSSLQNAGLGSSTLSGRFEFFSRHPSEAAPHSVRPARGYTNQLSLLPSSAHQSTIYNPSTLSALPPTPDDDDDTPPTPPPPHPPFHTGLTNNNSVANHHLTNRQTGNVENEERHTKEDSLTQPWFSIPEPVPLSPLPCRSEGESDITQHGHPRGRGARRGEGPQGSSDDDIDEYAGSDVYHQLSGAEEDEGEGSRAGGSPESYLEYSTENLHLPQQHHSPQQLTGGHLPSSSSSSHLPPPPASSHSQDRSSTTNSSEAKEDPLWYDPRDSGNFETLPPLPYETASKALQNSPQHRSVKWRDLEERKESVETGEPVVLLSSPHHSSFSSGSSRGGDRNSFQGNISLSSTSSSQSALRERGSPRNLPRMAAAPSPEELPVFRETSQRNRELNSGFNSHPLPRRQNPPVKGIPRTSSASESLRHCIKRSPPPPHSHTPPVPSSHHYHHHPAFQQRAAMLAAPPSSSPYPRPMARTASDNTPSAMHCPVHHTASYQSPPDSNVTTSSLQAQVGLPGLPAVEVLPQALAAAAGPGGDKGSYHSEGPSVEARLNQIIRHPDGSETVQSLV